MSILAEHDSQLASLVMLGKLITEATSVLKECQFALAASIEARRLETQIELVGHPTVVPTKQDQGDPALISLAAAAERLGVTLNTLRAMRKAGALPEPIHVSARRRMYLKVDIESWLKGGGAAHRAA